VAGSRFAVLIPALNEVGTIADVIAGARAHARVIVIDNGSTDGTAAAARGAGAEVLRLQQPGYDSALNAGFARAAELELDYALTMDADGQHDASDIPRFRAALEHDSPVVYGVRGGPKRLAEHLFALVTRLGWGIHDPLCGMKAYQMHLYRQRGHFDSCRSIGSELLLFAARSGMPVVGIPISISERTDRPRFGNAIRANLTLLGAMLRALSASRPTRSPDKRSASGGSDSKTTN